MSVVWTSDSAPVRPTPPANPEQRVNVVRFDIPFQDLFRVMVKGMLAWMCATFIVVVAPFFFLWIMIIAWNNR
jgi:hypothetical protein